MATQFHMWDMFKVMDETSANGQRNLAMMLAHLLSSKALPLSVLKVTSIKDIVCVKLKEKQNRTGVHRFAFNEKEGNSLKMGGFE